MKALVFRPSSRSIAVEHVAVPTPGPNQILVKVQAVALNSVDVMNVDNPIALQDMRLRLVLLGRNDQVVPNHGVLVEHENMGGRIGLRDSSDKQVRRGGLERIKLRFGRLVVRG